MRYPILLLPGLLISWALPAQAQQRPVPAAGYRVETVPCWLDGKLRSRRFQLDKQTYTVRYADICAGPAVRADTAAGDSADGRPVIYRYPETRVRVLLTSAAGTREVIIRKDTFRRQLGREKEWPKLGLGTTTLRRIDLRNRHVVFVTFLGYEASDVGVLLRYAVGLDGQVHFLGIDDGPPMP